MWQAVFDSIWTWWGLAGTVVIGCVVVGYFIPSLRLAALAAAGVALSAASIFTKGYNARSKLEQKRREEAVAKRQKDDARIDNRPDTPADVSKRLRDGSF